MAEYTKCLVINDFLLATVHKDALIFPLMRTPSAALSLWDLPWAAVRGCFLFGGGGRPGHLQGAVPTFAPKLPYAVGWKRALWLPVNDHSLLQGLEILMVNFFFLRIPKNPLICHQMVWVTL